MTPFFVFVFVFWLFSITNETELTDNEGDNKTVKKIFLSDIF